ncbi:MAG: Glu/Leu/Phe/Val family dehydrogenase [Acidimicrobiales bacterium]
MSVLHRMVEGEYEQIAFFHDLASGLRAIIAIHSTVLGPALGGTRCYAYPDEEAALTDVMRLSRAMTYKAAAAGIDFGGGKAVIIGDPATLKSAALLEAYARCLDALGGRYLTAEDVGTTQSDMDTIRKTTAFVTGCSLSLGGSGDPSEPTAVGLHHAIRAVDAGSSFVVAGVGKVGTYLTRRLVADGADVTIADIDSSRADALRDELGVAVVPADVAHRTACDVFSPCGLGGVLNARTIPELACKAVVGAANNQLLEPDDAARLAARGIVYAPDFVVNAGGVINLAEEAAPGGYDRDRALERVAAVGVTTGEVLADARARRVTPLHAAEERAERRINAARATRAAG